MRLDRKTVRDDVSFEGLGLHSGELVRCVVSPGENGIQFRKGALRLQAIPENVTDTRRCTKLGEISVVEHIMSALAALEITDAEIEVLGPDLPAMGGCSEGYMAGLIGAGFSELAAAELPPVFRRVYLQEGAIKVAISKGAGHWRYEFLTGERWPGSQVFETEDVVASFAGEIAPARTFAFEEELPAIQAAGLGKGLDEGSALILDTSGYRQSPRFPDEPARHKMLDLIGDLYLAGIPIRALNVVSERSGHAANVTAAQRLREMLSG